MKYSYLIPAVLVSAMFMFSSCEKDSKDPDTPTVYTYASVASENENIPCGGVISTQYSDSPYGSDISKVVDNDPATSFVTSHKEFFILWSGKRSFALKSYSIMSSAGEGTVPESWVLSGSNDNKTWVQIDKKSGQVFSGANTRKDYRTLSTSSYKYYRFVFTTTSANTAIAEIVLADGGVANIDDLMYLSHGSTLSSQTPMGEFCENRHKTTEEDIAWLADPKNEPSVIGGDGSLEWQDYDVTLFPFGSPVPADVNQQAIGDCCALAVFGSMAYVFPDFIKDIIKNNGDGTFTVKTYDPQGKSVDVTVSSRFLNGGVTGKNDVRTWSAVLEKVVMKWNSVYHTVGSIEGIPTEYTSPIFTGNGESFAFDYGVLDYAQMERVVTVMLNKGWIVVGGFHVSDQIIGDGPFKTVTAHAFSFILDDHTSAKYGARNPWGYSNGTTDYPDPYDGVAPIVDDGRTQPLIDLRICNPGAALDFRQKYLLPYTPPSF
ncbi:MAG: hypothetical protein II693_00380 [Bacteroidales bacterium]|nr:hypothetical protein [Bacteroidales bacterium]MEE3464085.1 hypothetical protein [Candidatus Cryptobacteroides sp.]